MPPPPQVLIPWNPAEAITVAEGGKIARRSPRTVREWAARFDIGRRVAGGDWVVSRVALLMLLEGNDAALSAYLRGDRESLAVADYFKRANVDF